jgi:ABC-type Co2+ transport system permease subunit
LITLRFLFAGLVTLVGFLLFAVPGCTTRQLPVTGLAALVVGIGYVTAFVGAMLVVGALIEADKQAMRRRLESAVPKEDPPAAS